MHLKRISIALSSETILSRHKLVPRPPSSKNASVSKAWSQQCLGVQSHYCRNFCQLPYFIHHFRFYNFDHLSIDFTCTFSFQVLVYSILSYRHHQTWKQRDYSTMYCNMHLFIEYQLIEIISQNRIWLQKMTAILSAYCFYLPYIQPSLRLAVNNS